jgi:hypothetical protein
LTFSSPPVEAYRARNDVVGDRMLENLETGDRGSYREKLVNQAPEWQGVQDILLLTAERRSYWQGVVDECGIRMNVEGGERRGRV